MIDVLGIPMFDSDSDKAVSEFLSICRQNSAGTACISATGAHGLVYAREHLDFHDTLSRFYWNLPDGMPTVWIGRIKGASGMRRCYGPDFFADIIRHTRELPVNHFLCGGQEGVADDLRKECAERFGNHNIVGTYSPPFREMDEEEIHRLALCINELETQVVWIGLSTPKQEKFALRLSRHVDAQFIVTVGAAFDFHTGRVRQAPTLIQKIGLEWLFRLCMEPGRLFPRYLAIVPKFIYFNLLELLSTRPHRS